MAAIRDAATIRYPRKNPKFAREVEASSKHAGVDADDGHTARSAVPRSVLRRS
ncbi:hypothetical protein HNP40_002718 [Mycobacteroides chelonae]|nr:hypothetical protein [Mycobacteroides chelonae]